MSYFFSINNKNLPDEIKSNAKALSQLRDIVPPSLEHTPMAFILEYSNTDLIVNHSNLMDKSMKILQIVIFFIISTLLKQKF